MDATPDPFPAGIEQALEMFEKHIAATLETLDGYEDLLAGETGDMMSPDQQLKLGRICHELREATVAAAQTKGHLLTYRARQKSLHELMGELTESLTLATESIENTDQEVS